MAPGRESHRGTTANGRGRRSALLSALLGAVALAVLATSSPANAAVFTVKTTGDSLGPCDALCTLRSAISEANASTGTTDLIHFDISPGGVQTIQPGSALPEITDPVVIDGTTQPGFHPQDTPIVELDGSFAGASTNGITIASTGGGSTIGALVINRFARGILIGSVTGGIGSSNNVVAGNYIGTDVTGTLDRGNAFQGVMITPRDATDNRIGGSSAADRNVISGNGQQGVVIEGQSGGPGANTVTNNRLWGNYIGTNASGTGALGNSHYGVSISNALDSEIGGNSPALRNVISSNLGGVVIGNFNSTGNRVEGNYIGTDVNGSSPLGNTHHGVSVSFTTGVNTVGGTGAGTGNVLAYNFRNGVFAGGNGGGLQIVGNSIHSNSELGIDLNPSGNSSIFGNGVTPNDVGDADTGGNDLQNFPFITSATSSGGSTAMEGGLNSKPNRTYRIEFFSNPSCDSSGNGEGRTFLGSFNSTTDGNGDVGFGGATVPTAVANGDKVTATATDLTTSETSEFSACQTAVAVDPATFTVNSTADTDDGSCTVSNCTLREAINRANAVAGHDTISFGSAVDKITPGAQLPQITEDATIDGTTQPAYTGTPVVELDGGSTDSSSVGLILSGGSTVKGLVINRFNTQIMVIGSGNIIEGNFLGTNSDGTAAPPASAGGNLMGVNLISSGNRVGGTTVASRNVISGNTVRGIWVGGTANEIQGNYIGTDKTGTNSVGNFLGVEVDAPNTLVGGTSGVSPGGLCTGACNLMSGNQIAGVVFRSGSFGGHVEGNFIGTDPTGSVPVSNQSGVWLDGSPNNTVGGTNPSQRNVISGNSLDVFVNGSTASGNAVAGNYIGTNSAGTAGLNTGTGISIHTSAHDNTIGGSAPGTRNVISGHAGWGVLLGGDGTGNQVKGNFIGADHTGTSGAGNAQGGVQIQASGSAIGGTGAGEANTIAFNGGAGVAVLSGTGNNVLGNSTFSNAGLGVDLGNDGVTQNDPGDFDGGPNNLQNFPELTSASPDSSTTVRGTLDTQAGTYRLEFFSSSSCAPGSTEGRTFEGSHNLDVTQSGPTPFIAVLSNTLPLGSFVTATATDANGNTSELSECIQVAPANSADLRITKGDSPDPVTAGTNLTYTLTVTNDGPSEAPNVTLTDNLPAGLSGAQYCTGSGCTPNAAWTGSLDLGTVASGSSVEVRIRATVGAGVTAPTLSNEASVSGLIADPNEANNTVNESTTVVTRADVRITKQDDLETVPVLAGNPLTYTISVTNDGPSNAQNVQLADVLPSELTGAKYCQGTSCGAFSSNWTGALDLDTVAAGQTQVVRIQARVRSNTDSGTVIHNVASITSPTADPDASDNSDAEDTAVETDANIDVFKLAVGQRRNNSPSNPNTYNPPVVAGDYLIYGLRVNNHGPSDARNVVLTDTLPTQLEEENATYCFGLGCQDWNTPWTGTLGLGTLVPGDSVVVRIRAKVPPNVVNNTIINNQGSVTSSTPDSNTTLNTFSLNTRIITRADLDVTKTANPSPNVVAGERITYTLTLLNDGPSDAQNVVLNDALPASQYDDARFCVGQSCVVNGFSPPWNGSTGFSTVPNGEARYVTINARVLPSVLEGTNLHNVATPTSSTIDPITGNNPGVSDTNVHARADLSITKSDSGPTLDISGPDPVIAGEYLQYKLTVSNAGPSDAQNVRIEDQLPNELDAANARYCIGTSCAIDANSPMWTFPFNIGTVAAGGSVVVKVKARVRPNTSDGPISNLAAVLSDTVDPNIHDPNYDQEDTTVITRANVDISKFGVGRPKIDGVPENVLIAGNQVLYVIQVNNWGPSDARNVTVDDVLPTQLQNARYCTFIKDDAGNNPPCEDYNQPWPASNTIDLGTMSPEPNVHSIIIRVLADVPANTPKGTVLRNPPPAPNPPPQTFVRVTTSTADPIASGNRAATQNTVDTRAELHITKTAAPDPVTAGEKRETETPDKGPLVYEITAFNDGPSDAQDVTVTDNMAQQLVRNDSRYPDPKYCVGANCTNFDTTLPASGVVNIGTLPAHQNEVVRIKAVVNPSTLDCVDCIHNEASVESSETFDPGALPNTATTDTDVVTEADVGVVKEVDSRVVAGTDVTYKLTVTNHGPSDAQNVRLTDDLPNLLDEPNARYCLGDGCTDFSSPWTGALDLGTMGPEESKVVRIRAPLPANVPADTDLCNAASIGSDTVDNEPGNDSSGDVCVRTQADVDMQLTKDNTQTLVGQGTDVQYTIDVRNNGPSYAQGVTVTDDLHPKMSFASASHNGSQVGNNVVWNLGAFAPGESRTITVTLRPTSAAGDPFGRFDGPITNSASVSSSTTETNNSNNSDDGQGLRVCTVLGTDADENISIGVHPNVSNGPDWLCGKGGNDTINGGGGDDVIQGDDGNDTLENAASADNDIVEGGNGADTVWGGRGRDDLSGAFFDQTGGSAGRDPDVDTLTYADETRQRTSPPGPPGVPGVTVVLAEHRAETVDGRDPLASAGGADDTFENVVGTIFTDELIGDAANNNIHGQGCTNTGCATDYYSIKPPGQREVGGDVIRGREGDDTLTGAEGADAIRGGPGTDIVQGGNGNDIVSGGLAPEDVGIPGDAGNDSINGNAGLDLVWYLSAPAVNVNLSIGQATGEGTDALGGIENIQGSFNNDVLIGSGGINSIDGGPGNDSIQGLDNHDSSAFQGFPTATSAYPGLNGGGGNDTVTGGTGNDYVGGGDDNDDLSGNEGSDTVSAGPGADRASGGLGNDSVFGGNDNDILIEGNDGNDIVSPGNGADTASGGEGNDAINGGPGNDILYGNAGDDTIGGDEGDDTMYGHTGADALTGAAGDDSLFGNENIDRLIGGANRDRLNGGAPNTAPGDQCEFDSIDFQRVNCERGLA